MEGESAQGRRVFVGNLSYQTRSLELTEVMAQAGTVVRAEVLMTQSGRSKGCGLVEYSTRAVRLLLPSLTRP